MPSPYDDVILFDGRFFAVDNNGRTVVVDFSSLKLTLAASPVFGGDKKFLLESCGEMLLVDMYLSLEAVDGDPIFVDEFLEQPAFYMNERTVKFKVFKFVDNETSWVEVNDLEDKMLFLGDDSTFSASASDILPPCGRSSVFFNGNVFIAEDLSSIEDQDFGVFDIMTGKIEQVHKLPEYAKLFWPPPPWITSNNRRLRDAASSVNNTVSQSNEDENVPEFCIDAGTQGNFARFINHSCEPNLFVQCVLSSHQDLRLARVVLFTADNIPPLQELTYDYGYTLDSVHGPDGKVKELKCFCGALPCRKRLY